MGTTKEGALGDGVVAVRLEGGLADHILGMRVLHFVNAARRGRQILVYSDACGHPSQLQIAAMSPFVSRVLPIRSTRDTLETSGRLENVHPEDLAEMCSHETFVDTWGGDMFVSAAVTLRAPLFEILRATPRLVVTADSEAQATTLLARYPGAAFVGCHFSGTGTNILDVYRARLEDILLTLLGQKHVVVLNMFTSSYDFSHWPEPERSIREYSVRREAELLESFRHLDDRLATCCDMPLATIAALLRRCSYFIGVDNGIKQLAWALGVPHSFFVPFQYPVFNTLRWMPDLNRMVLFDCPADELNRHLMQARYFLDQGPLAERRQGSSY